MGEEGSIGRPGVELRRNVVDVVGALCAVESARADGEGELVGAFLASVSNWKIEIPQGMGDWGTLSCRREILRNRKRAANPEERDSVRPAEDDGRGPANHPVESVAEGLALGALGQRLTLALRGKMRSRREEEGR